MAASRVPFRVVRRNKEWWITNVPPYVVDGRTYSEYGPYKTKDEAQDDARGVALTFAKINEEEEKRRK